MTSRKMVHLSLMIAVFMFFITVQDTHAQYIDPGTGSYLVQFLLAGFLALIFFFKHPKALFKTLKDKFFRKKNVKK